MATITQDTATCDSMADLVRWIQNTRPAAGAGNSSITNSARDSWDLDLGYEGAIELALGKTRWDEGERAMVKGAAVASGLRKAAQAPQFKYDVAGFVPNVPTMLSGEPEYMLTVDPYEAEQASHQQVVSIALSGFSCGCSGFAMVNRGVAFLSLVDALESAGTRCEVWFASSIDNGPKKMADLRVCIKQAGDHWQPRTAAAALAHPGMFRRLWFAAMERFPQVNGATNGGYGRCRLQKPEQYTFGIDYQIGDGPYATLNGALRHVQMLAREAGHDVTLINDKAGR